MRRLLLAYPIILGATHALAEMAGGGETSSPSPTASAGGPGAMVWIGCVAAVIIIGAFVLRFVRR